MIEQSKNQNFIIQIFMIIKVNFRWRVCRRQYLSQDYILEIYRVSALNQSLTIIDVNQSVFRKICFFDDSVDFLGDSPMEATIISIFNLSSLLEASFDKNINKE